MWPRNAQKPTRTKLIATIGPASASDERLAEMLDAGLDVCRLNFSHGTLDDHAQVLARVRRLAAERSLHVAVLGDLCGPKIRLNAVAGGRAVLTRGATVRITRGQADCTAGELTVTYERFLDEVRVGQRIYIDDGLVRLLVTDRRPDELTCTCTTGGAISSRKGVNLPDTRLAIPALTDKDRHDLRWALDSGLDFVALSFVRRPEDVQVLRETIRQSGRPIGVALKMEMAEALENLDALVGLADAVLVARGDMGVELDVWQVPLWQKRITARCRAAGVPVIIATQMLQSMVASPMPTRAEVSDVANAILDGVDAVMLSAESAVGDYPVQAVEMMGRVAAAAERLDEPDGERGENPGAPGECGVISCASGECAPSARVWCEPSRRGGAVSAVADAAVRAALYLNARLVAAWTKTGETVRVLARHRLPMPLVGLSADERVLRRMNLLYGVVPLRAEPISNPAQVAAGLDHLLKERDLAASGDTVVVVCSTRPTQPGMTDATVVHRVS